MKDRKCDNCGATLDVEAGEKCKYCGSIATKEETPIIINNYYVSDDAAEYNESNTNTPITVPSVDINWTIFILLFIFFPVMAVIYVIIKASKSKK